MNFTSKKCFIRHCLSLLVNEHAIFENRAALRILFLQYHNPAGSREQGFVQTSYSRMLEEVLQLFYKGDLYVMTEEDEEILVQDAPFAGAFKKADTADRWSASV